MSITFVTPFPANSGGIRVIATYARMLEARGHLVHVVSLPETRRYSWKKRAQFLMGLDKPRPVRARTPFLDFLGERHIWAASAEEIRAGEVPDADIVIATFWRTAEWVAGFPASKGRKVYLIQGYEVSDTRPEARVAATFASDMTKIAVSSYIRRAIEENHAPRGEIAVVPNAVDTGQFDAPPRTRGDRLTVGFVYSRAAIKNIPLAVAALTQVRISYPDLKCLAFGRGPVGADVPLPDWITYHQTPAQNEIPKLYAACDLWLFPTRREGFGLPILEAMACRTPVLATDAGAATDLIDGHNGMILPHDPEAFAQAILRFAGMGEAEWQNWSRAAYATARQNRWEDATDRLLAVLLETARAQPG